MVKLWDCSNYYLMGIAILLSVITAQAIILLVCILKKKIGVISSPIQSKIPELLSLLILPATYEEGLLLLKSVDSYKGYLELIKELVMRQRQTGHPTRQGLEDLRGAVVLDMKFENEQRLYLRQSFIQYFAYMLMTYLMAFLFALSGFRLSLDFYFYIVLGHIFGLCLLVFYILRRQKILKKIFSSFVPNLYQVMTTFDQSNLLEKKAHHLLNMPEMMRFNRVLEELVSRRMRLGVSIAADLALLSKEFWLYWENHWKQVALSVERVKFFLMIIFFGGGYMALLYGISSQVASEVFA